VVVDFVWRESGWRGIDRRLNKGKRGGERRKVRER